MTISVIRDVVIIISGLLASWLFISLICIKGEK